MSETVKLYYDNGNIKAEQETVKGLREGLTVLYNKDGSIDLKLTYKKNHPVSGFKFSSSGQKTALTDRELRNYR